MAWGGWSPRFHQMNTECSIGEGGVCVWGGALWPSFGGHTRWLVFRKQERKLQQPGELYPKIQFTRLSFWLLFLPSVDSWKIQHGFSDLFHLLGIEVGALWMQEMARSASSTFTASRRRSRHAWRKVLPPRLLNEWGKGSTIGLPEQPQRHLHKCRLSLIVNRCENSVSFYPNLYFSSLPIFTS